MYATLILLAALAAPQQAPKPPQAPPLRDYAACTAHVAAGGRAILAVGVPAPPGAYYVATLEDRSPGLWECFQLNGKLMMQVVPKPMEAQPIRRVIRECVNGVCREVEVK